MPIRKDPVAPRGKSGLLAKIGRALWGESFIAPMATCCGVNRKQVRRWLDGIAPVPLYAWLAIIDETNGRRTKLRGLVDNIAEQLPEQKVVM